MPKTKFNKIHTQLKHSRNNALQLQVRLREIEKLALQIVASARRDRGYLNPNLVEELDRWRRS